MINLDINIIDTHSSLTMAIADVSVYSNTPINNATIEITPPGFNKISLPFQPRSLNTYNSNDIGITCVTDGSQLVDLPDGFYQLTYSINPNNTTFINYGYYRTDILECRLENSLLKSLSSRYPDTKEERVILDVQILINGAIAAANRLDTATANKMYKKASDVLNKLENNKCNNCGNL